jgi:hypothetical protein
VTGRLRAQLVAAVVASALGLAAAGCGGGGGGGGAEATVPPPKVPVAIVPPTLSAGALTLTQDAQAKKAFGKLSDRALVADGRLWQIREGERLVATLQVSTVKSKVDLTDAGQRDTIVKHILPGARQEIEVDGLALTMSDANDKTMFVWFGRDLFQVLQVKSTKLDPEAIVTDLVRYELQSPEWKSLAPGADVSS